MVYDVFVTKLIHGTVRVIANDEFEARCIALDMSGEAIELYADWYEDEIEVSDNVEEWIPF